MWFLKGYRWEMICSKGDKFESRSIVDLLDILLQRKLYFRRSTPRGIFRDRRTCCLPFIPSFIQCTHHGQVRYLGQAGMPSARGSAGLFVLLSRTGKPSVIQTPGWRGRGYWGYFPSLSPGCGSPGARPWPWRLQERARQCEGAGPGQGRAPAPVPPRPSPSLPPAGGGRGGPRRAPIPPPPVHGGGGSGGG